MGSQGRLDLGGYGYYTASGLWRLLNNAATNATLEVGRHLILTNGGRMTIVSASTNSAAPFFGARVSVGQTLYLGTNCWITLVSSVTNGGSAFLTCRDLVVASNAGMIADALGFAGGRNSSGLGYRAVRYGGGGHGGAGGAYSQETLAAKRMALQPTHSMREQGEEPAILRHDIKIVPDTAVGSFGSKRRTLSSSTEPFQPTEEMAVTITAAAEPEVRLTSCVSVSAGDRIP